MKSLKLFFNINISFDIFKMSSDTKNVEATEKNSAVHIIIHVFMVMIIAIIVIVLLFLFPTLANYSSSFSF